MVQIHSKVQGRQKNVEILFVSGVCNVFIVDVNSFNMQQDTLDFYLTNPYEALKQHHFTNVNLETEQNFKDMVHLQDVMDLVICYVDLVSSFAFFKVAIDVTDVMVNFCIFIFLARIA